MYKVAVINQKGGVGKTTVVLGLASAAIQQGLRVLIMDLDPQANTTDALAVTGEGMTVSDVLLEDRDGAALDALWETKWGGDLRAIPSSLELAQRDEDTKLGTEFRLRKALNSPELDSMFDLCLIDCPPSVGRLVSNSLIAADSALIVTEPSVMASRGLAAVQQTIATIQDNYNADLFAAGIIINKVNDTKEAVYRIGEVEKQFGKLVWKPYLRVRTALVAAAGATTPIHLHRPKDADSIAALDAHLRRLMRSAPKPTAKKTANKTTKKAAAKQPAKRGSGG